MNIFSRYDSKATLLKQYLENKDKKWIGIKRFQLINSHLDMNLQELSIMMEGIWEGLITPGPVYIIIYYFFVKLSLFHQDVVVDETIFAYLGDCPVRRTLPRKPGSHQTGILGFLLCGKVPDTNRPYCTGCEWILPGSFDFVI